MYSFSSTLLKKLGRLQLISLSKLCSQYTEGDAPFTAVNFYELKGALNFRDISHKGGLSGQVLSLTAIVSKRHYVRTILIIGRHFLRE